MKRYLRRGILSLFVPVILLAVVACPGIIIDHIQVTLGPNGAVVGGTITFSCFSPVTEDIVTYRWEFGDGNTAEGQTVTHVYSAPGDYVVECHIVTINSVLIFKKLLKMSVLPIVVDSLIEPGGGTSLFCTGGTATGPASGVLFGSRQAAEATNGGPGVADVSLLNSLNLELTDSCNVELSLRYPGTGFASDPVNVSQHDLFTFTVVSISKATTGSLELHDGTNSHQEVIGMGAANKFSFLLSDFENGGVDMTNISRVIFTINGIAPLTIEIAPPLQFE